MDFYKILRILSILPLKFTLQKLAYTIQIFREKK